VVPLFGQRIYFLVELLFKRSYTERELHAEQRLYRGQKGFCVRARCSQLVRTHMHIHAHANNERSSIVLYIQASPTQQTRPFGSKQRRNSKKKIVPTTTITLYRNNQQSSSLCVRHKVFSDV